MYLVVVGEIAGMKFRWRRGWKTLGKYVGLGQPANPSLALFDRVLVVLAWFYYEYTDVAPARTCACEVLV